MRDSKKILFETSPVKRYATYKTESGMDCKGIQGTLNKPHGLKELMGQIIQELHKGPKRFVPFSKKLAKNNSFTQILEAIDILVIDGIIQTKSKNKKPNKSNLEWELQTISLDPRVQKEVSQKEIVSVEQYEKFKIRINMIIEKTKPTFLKSHLTQCMNNRVLTSPDGVKVCGSEAWVKYQSITLTLAYAIVLLDEDKRESLVISERIWGKSKILDRYKKDITLVTGLSLNQMNLTSMPEVTFIHGDVTYTYKGYRASFLAGSPCSLTEVTIKGLDIEHVGIDKIFIIENLAVFQEILMRAYQERPNVLLFWGAGYLSSPRLRLLKKVLLYKPVPVYIWSDLDSDGLGLTLDIIKKVRAYSIDASPVLMSSSELDLAKGVYKASNHHNLNDPELLTVFPDVIERIKLQNVMEQEELLLHYDLLKNKLP